METKRLLLKVVCQAWYDSYIDVPENLSFEEAMQYAEEHIDECPIENDLNYIPDSDELDVENCEFE